MRTGCLREIAGLATAVVVIVLCCSFSCSHKPAPSGDQLTPIVAPAASSNEAPKLLVTSAGDHLDVRAAIGNKVRWRVAGDQLVLVAVSKTGELLDWSYSNPFLCGPQPQPIPTPTPGPGPSPTPTPAPTPAPVVPQQLWITIVHESADRTPGFMAAINSQDLDKAIKAGGHRFRLVDQDAKDEHGQVPGYLANYIARAKAQGLPYMFLTDKDGKPLWEGKMPIMDFDIIKLVKQYGGSK